MGARLRTVLSVFFALAGMFGLNLVFASAASAGGGVDPGCTTINQTGVGYLDTIKKRGAKYVFQYDATGGGIVLSTTKTSVVVSVSPDAQFIIDLNRVEVGGVPYLASNNTITFPKSTMKGKNAEAYLCGHFESYPFWDCSITGTNDLVATKDFVLYANRYDYPESITTADPGQSWTLKFYATDRFETVVYRVEAVDQNPDQAAVVVESGSFSPLSPPSNITCSEIIYAQP